jgi:hypothetical protein
MNRYFSAGMCPMNQQNLVEIIAIHSHKHHIRIEYINALQAVMKIIFCQLIRPVFDLTNLNI